MSIKGEIMDGYPSSLKSEFEELYGNEFFILDSDNINNIKSKLYGYIISENKVIFNEKDIEDNLPREGTYVYIKSDENEISIHQDLIGSYGLYLFEKENYFAISNSFLKLVEFIKHKYELSLNFDFANALIGSMCSHICDETLVNEIRALPRDSIVHINKLKKKVEIEIIEYTKHQIPINSKEGLDILDNWFYKWINIIRTVKAKTNNMQVDLSGGFDTRMTMMLILNSNIDFNKFKVQSLKGTHRESFKEDYEIASQIAEEFNFELNKPGIINEKKVLFKDKFTTLDTSFYIKLGLTNQLSFIFSKYEQPLYSFNGALGGTVREVLDKTPQEFKYYYEKRVKRLDESLIEPSFRIYDSTFQKLAKKFNITDCKSKELVDLLYNENRYKNHFGKLAVERFFANHIRFSPCNDQDLHRLKLTNELTDDQNLLIAVMFLRFCPKLLDFKFEGGRAINDETIEIAKRINEIKPFIPREYEFISGPELNNEEISENNEELENTFGPVTISNYIRDLFYSRKFEMEFKKYFTDNLYNNLSKNIENKTYFPLQSIIPIVSIMKIINDIEFSRKEQDYDFNAWTDSFFDDGYNNNDGIEPQFRELLINYGIGRIDMINQGNENNEIEILENSDRFLEYYYPQWFKRENGQGLVITSKKLKLDLKIKCINDGELNIYLKSKQMKDKKGNAFPVYIDYTNVTINGENLLKNPKLVTNNKPHIIQKPVKDSEILDLHIEWLPFNNNSYYYDRSRYYIKKINKLNKEIEDLKKEIDNAKIN